MGTCTDVSEQRQAEEAVLRSEQQLIGIVDNSPAVIYLKDLEGRYLLVNREFTRLFGRTPQQIVGETDHAAFPHELAEQLRANDLAVLAAGRPMGVEEAAPYNGEVRTYLSTKFPIYNANGEAYALGGISTDITERKRHEEATAFWLRPAITLLLAWT
ncbi:MAG: PAS domain-containing protein [Chloroflexia bacterium]